MLLKNASYLDENYQIVQGDLLIRDGKIIIEEPKGDSYVEVIECSNYIIIPGLFNSHYHGYSYVAKGIGKDIKIEDWCNDSVQGNIQTQLFENIDQLSDEDYQLICMKSYVEMVKNGITFVSESEPGNNPGMVAEGISKIGLRGLVDTYGQVGEYYLKQLHDVSYGTHLLEEEDITNETIAECIHNKEKYHSALFLTHCMENDWRRDLIYSNYQKSSVTLYKANQLLDHNTILFHGVYLNDEDIELIADSGSTVVHCPVTNLWTGAGIAPIHKMLKNGVNVSLGTDYASTDMWETMRLAYLLLKTNAPVSSFKAEDIFQMATLHGAKAYHQDSLGSIKHGYYADLVFIERDSFQPNIHTSSFSNLVHNLLMETKVEKIHHVMINGKWIMRDRELLMVDEEAINEKYKQILDKLLTFRD